MHRLGVSPFSFQDDTHFPIRIHSIIIKDITITHVKSDLDLSPLAVFAALNTINHTADRRTVPTINPPIALKALIPYILEFWYKGKTK